MCPFLVPDLTGKKIVFPDWTFIQAGYGYRASRPPEKDEPHRNFCKLPYGIELRIFPPKVDKAPLIKADFPWENFYIAAYSTVIYDPEANMIGDTSEKPKGIFRLYYECFIPMDSRWDDLNTIFCYAESIDLKKWIKPSLGIVEFQGSRDNNILFSPGMNLIKSGLHGTHVFIDPNGLPDQRYKLTYCGVKNRTYACTSSDGLHWIPQPNVLIESEADSQNIVEWDNRRKKYIAFTRRTQFDRRGINYSETEDFWNWPIPKPLIISDPNLPPDADYYTNAYHKWPGTENLEEEGLSVSIMFPAMYYRTSDKVIPEILFSRNNSQWFRPLANPLWDPMGAVYFGKGIWSQNSGEWGIFIANYEDTHNIDHFQGKPVGGLYIARFREDGFSGIHAEGLGEFWTIPYKCRGGSIQVNATGPRHSWMRVEIIDALTNNVIEEKDFAHCTPLYGDSLWSTLNWDDGMNLDDYDDVEMILHIQMYQKTLFALKFG